jgi:DNA polymerase I
MFDALFPQGIWCVDFEYALPDGRPAPHCVVVREMRTGRLIRKWKPLGDGPPYPVGSDALFVCYSAQAEISCHIALGWPIPARVLDLCAEYSDITSGLRPNTEWRALINAMERFGLAHAAPAEKKAMQDRALQGDPWADQEIIEMLDYCQTDVDALRHLLPAMLPQINIHRAVYRGRYMAAVAWMEWVGVPVDMQVLERLLAHWEAIQARLIDEIDAQYHVYENGHLRFAKLQAYFDAHDIPWPRTPTGRPCLDEETLGEMAEIYPELVPFRELHHTLSAMRLSGLKVWPDGRNRTGLRAFATKTGRNAPSSKEFVFGPAKWVRCLIKPEPGSAIAYVDLEQAEFGIAAALSGDIAMQQAYRAADPYLAFARQAGVDIPEDATDATHPEIRAQFKICVLATQYCQGARGLAEKLRGPMVLARSLLEAHYQTYSKFWAWIEREVDHGYLRGFMTTCFGWHIHRGEATNRRTFQNFPMQAHCAEILRLSCCLATEAGIKVCCPVHDALLIESPVDRIEEDVTKTRALIAEASREVLGGFELRTDVKIVRYPDRYVDKRGVKMWEIILGLLEEVERKSVAAE